MKNKGDLELLAVPSQVTRYVQKCFSLVIHYLAIFHALIQRGS